MASAHTVADDIVYNLISIQYHSLQAADLYSVYLADAHSAEHSEVTEFIRKCQEQDNERAQRCHELLKELTAEGGIG